jgi:hypothetical protein
LTGPKTTFADSPREGDSPAISFLRMSVSILNTDCGDAGMCAAATQFHAAEVGFFGTVCLGPETTIGPVDQK